MYYVYHLIDPRTSKPFYIGKGTNKRAWYHLIQGFDPHNPFKSRTIDSIRAVGLEPEVKLIAENLNDQQSLDLEILEIAKYGRAGLDPAGILTNRTLGGRGGDTSLFFKESTKQKWSVDRIGLKNPLAKLTSEQVLEIYRSTEATKVLSSKFNVSSATVIGIKRRLTYTDVLADIAEPAGLSNSRRRLLTTDQIRDIFLFSGAPSEFKEQFGISVTVARNIKNKVTYSHLTSDLTNPGEIRLRKLTWTDVQDIRASAESDLALSERFKVSEYSIREIRTGRSRRFS